MIEIDVYANGQDPFAFPFGDFLIHFHAGARADRQDPPTRTTVTPTDDGHHVPIPVPYNPPPATEVAPPEIEIVGPEAANRVRDLLDTLSAKSPGKPARLRVDVVGDAASPHVQAVFREIQGFRDRDIHVDVAHWAGREHG